MGAVALPSTLLPASLPSAHSPGGRTGVSPSPSICEQGNFVSTSDASSGGVTVQTASALSVMAGGTSLPGVRLVFAMRVRGSCVLPERCWRRRQRHARKEGVQGVALRQCLHTTMPLIHPVGAATALTLFVAMHTDDREITHLIPAQGPS